MNGEKPFMNPYLAGFLLGLTLLVSFIVLGADLRSEEHTSELQSQ